MLCKLLRACVRACACMFVCKRVCRLLVHSLHRAAQCDVTTVQPYYGVGVVLVGVT